MKPKGWKTLFLLLGAGFVAVAILIGTFYFMPSAPPKVSLKFEGFTGTGTNAVAQIRFINEGKKPVWWTSGYSLFLNSNPSAQTTVFYSGLSSMAESSNFVFIVTDVPANCTNWRVGTSFYYYNHYPLKVMLTERGIFDWRCHQNTFFERARFNTAFWLMRHLPDPKSQTAHISTPFLTNQPPSDPVSPS